MFRFCEPPTTNELESQITQELAKKKKKKKSTPLFLMLMSNENAPFAGARTFWDQTMECTKHCTWRTNISQKIIDYATLVKLYSLTVVSIKQIYLFLK